MEAEGSAAAAVSDDSAAADASNTSGVEEDCADSSEELVSGPISTATSLLLLVASFNKPAGASSMHGVGIGDGGKDETGVLIAAALNMFIRTDTGTPAPPPPPPARGGASVFSDVAFPLTSLLEEDMMGNLANSED